MREHVAQDTRGGGAGHNHRNALSGKTFNEGTRTRHFLDVRNVLAENDGMNAVENFLELAPAPQSSWSISLVCGRVAASIRAISSGVGSMP